MSPRILKFDLPELSDSTQMQSPAETSQQAAPTIPDFKSKEMNCIMCSEKMFYSPENLVHVCLNESHGILCYFEPDSCWFAAKESTSLELAKRGIKFHFIPPNIFENVGIGADFKCDYPQEEGKNLTSNKSGKS